MSQNLLDLTFTNLNTDLEWLDNNELNPQGKPLPANVGGQLDATAAAADDDDDDDDGDVPGPTISASITLAKTVCEYPFIIKYRSIADIKSI